MTIHGRAGRTLRCWAIALLLAGTAMFVTGCRTLSFYSQAVAGHFELLTSAKSIEKLQRDPQTSLFLKQRFDVLAEIRQFAEGSLALPVDKQYTKYVALDRPFVVWNVEAAKEFSLQPKSWSYPFVGSLEYRGYFSAKNATEYAGYLRGRGLDVHCYGVTAYSTLGWFKDPVLSTFVYDPDPALAETIFHELAHQRVFVSGDKDFNEAFATTVGQEGVRRWLKSRGDLACLAAYEEAVKRDRAFVALVLGARQELMRLYGDVLTPKGTIKAGKAPPQVSPGEMRAEKQRILDQLATDYNALRSTWTNGVHFDSWFEGPVNNAKLNSIAAYYELVPGFQRLLVLNHDDLESFYRDVRRLAKKSQQERHEHLKTLARSTNSPE